MYPVCSRRVAKCSFESFIARCLYISFYSLKNMFFALMILASVYIGLFWSCFSIVRKRYVIFIRELRTIWITWLIIWNICQTGSTFNTAIIVWEVGQVWNVTTSNKQYNVLSRNSLGNLKRTNYEKLQFHKTINA